MMHMKINNGKAYLSGILARFSPKFQRKTMTRFCSLALYSSNHLCAGGCLWKVLHVPVVKTRLIECGDIINTLSGHADSLETQNVTDMVVQSVILVV